MRSPEACRPPKAIAPSIADTFVAAPSKWVFDGHGFACFVDAIVFVGYRNLSAFGPEDKGVLRNDDRRVCFLQGELNLRVHSGKQRTVVIALSPKARLMPLVGKPILSRIV